MKKFFAAALLPAAIFAAGPVYAEALPKAPPSSISLPGGESVRLIRPVSAGLDEEGGPVWAEAASVAPMRPHVVAMASWMGANDGSRILCLDWYDLEQRAYVCPANAPDLSRGGPHEGTPRSRRVFRGGNGMAACEGGHPRRAALPHRGAGGTAADPSGREERSKKDRMTGLFFMFPFPLPKGVPPTGSAALLPPVSPRRRSLQR